MVGDIVNEQQILRQPVDGTVVRRSSHGRAGDGGREIRQGHRKRLPGGRLNRLERGGGAHRGVENDERGGGDRQRLFIDAERDAQRGIPDGERLFGVVVVQIDQRQSVLRGTGSADISV